MAAFIGIIFLGMITFLARGSAIGSMAESIPSTNIIICSIFTPMLLLSELVLPISMLPAWLQPVVKAFPLTPVNTILIDIVYRAPLEDLWELGVMATWIIVACIITVKFFRWE